MNGVRPPWENGTILCEPIFQALPGLLKKNQQCLRQLSPKWADLRAIARRDVLEILGLDPGDLSKPWVMCGHQPEVCHPGVWAKYFVSKGLAESSAAVAFNLVADGDICRQMRLPFPLLSHDNRLSRGTLSVGQGPPGTSWEGASLGKKLDKCDSIWDQLAHRFGLDPLGQKYCPIGQGSLSEANSWQRRRAQLDLGLDLLDLKQSQLCRSVGFGRFLTSILCEIQRFSALHNRALAEFRIKQGRDNPAWPVANLGIEGEWYETPFWLFNTIQGPRMPLWVKAENKTLLLGGEPGKCLARVNVEHQKGWLESLSKLGFEIRPKALANTLFLRWLVCDLFVHGLGGAVYDQVTDALGRAWFGCEPPTFALVSATLRLPLPKVKESNEAALRREQRDLWWHPQRLCEPTGLNEADLKEWLSLRAQPEQNPRAKVLLWRLHSQANGHYRALDEEIIKARRDKAANTLADNREWPWIWYSDHSLRKLLCPLLDPQLYRSYG